MAEQNGTKGQYTPRAKTLYRESVAPEMMNRFGFKNMYQVPKLEKIVVNIGVNDARDNAKALEIAAAELSSITGQKPQVRKAKKSISNFKLREGMAIGLRVTLRGDRMYEFFDRLTSVVIPRIRDFRGLNPKGLDGRGNYNLGLTEQYVFPEVNVDKSDKARGMNVTFVTSAENDDDAREFLALMGMPFKGREGGKN